MVCFANFFFSFLANSKSGMCVIVGLDDPQGPFQLYESIVFIFTLVQNLSLVQYALLPLT